jgi:hypothetical protein
MRCDAQARATKCPAEKGWRWVALERSERTRTRTETQREEVGQPHTQSFGHKDAPCKLQVWTVTPGITRNAGAKEGSRGS